MDYLTGSNLLSSNQIVHSYQHLAAIGAAVLFVVEGAFLAIMVFSGKRTTKKIRARSING